MKKVKGSLSLLLIVTLIVFLSGCNQVKDAISGFIDSDEVDEAEAKTTKMEKEEIEEATVETEVIEEEVTEEEKTETARNVREAEASTFDNRMPFDEKLKQEGYDTKLLPNGFPFEIPYHFIIVADNLDEADASSYEAQFCFYLPLELEAVADLIGGFSSSLHQSFEVTNDILLQTRYTSDFGDGTVDYFIDNHDNTCAFFTWKIAGANVGDVFLEDGEFGEDPSTMVSAEELAQMDEGDEDEEAAHESEGNGAMAQANALDRVPANYQAIIDKLTDPEAATLFQITEIESIEEKIKNNEFTLEMIVKGHPEIFPYEWFPVTGEDDYVNSRWTRTFCTDVSLPGTMLKHLTMLNQYGAMIQELELTESNEKNQFGKVAFAFNDEYGTGSWQGDSILYVDRLDELQSHQCIQVTMEFSSELLPE